MYLRGFFALKPLHDYSLCSICILPQPAFYSQSAVCILHTVCILPLVRSLQSAVRSLRFTLTEITLVILLFRHFGISCFKQAKPFTKMYKLERKVFRRLLQELPDISKQTESQGSKRTNGDLHSILCSSKQKLIFSLFSERGSVKCRLRTDCGLLFLGLENNGTIVVTFLFAW